MTDAIPARAAAKSGLPGRRTIGAVPKIGVVLGRIRKRPSCSFVDVDRATRAIIDAGGDLRP